MFCKKLSQNDLNQLPTNTVVVTSNNRLATYIQTTLEKSYQSQNKIAWITPKIFPLENWLKQLWQQISFTFHFLLSPLQEVCIWENIIKSNSSHAFLQNSRTAELAKKTWKLIKLWQIPLQHLESFIPYHNEIRLLLEWGALFEELCQKNQWLNAEQLLQDLTYAIESNSNISLPQNIVLAGFEELAPAYENLFKKLSRHSEIFLLQNISTPESIDRISLANTEAEIIAMAHWAKHQIEQNAELKIGCIIPDILKLREQVESIFIDVFHPEKILTPTLPTKTDFNFSLGKKLTHYEMLNVAGHILDMSQGDIHPSLLTWLLQSPYLNQSEREIIFGSKLATAIQEWNNNPFPLHHLYHYLHQCITEFPDLTTWLNRIRNFIESIKSAPINALPSEWVSYFSLWLNVLGWPGYRTLNSLEYQLLQRWNKLLLEISSLDPITQQINQSQALHILQTLLSQTLFQPQTPETPIQILGILEAAGRPFDYLWIMGLHDGIWPAAPEANPFIPYEIQVQYKMPHSTAERELLYAERLTSGFLTSAQKIILSSPISHNDQELNVSPLISAFPLKKLHDVFNQEFPTTYLHTVFQSSQMEILQSDSVPAITLAETVPGGSDLLKQQSLCPFRAFAIYRLNAKNKKTRDAMGFSGLERGVIIHSLLDQLWQKLESQQTLKNLSELSLQQLIEKTIEKTLPQLLPTYYFEVYPKIISIEKSRLTEILKKWLANEKQRPTFNIVKQEFTRQIQIKGLNINVRIDRIDQVSDGSFWLIDYKTNRTEISNWFGTRPEEPQLPLYCVFGADDVTPSFSGIFFAEVLAQNSLFKGTILPADEERNISENLFFKLVPFTELQKKYQLNDWQHMLSGWRNTLETLASDFSEGIVTVDPLTPATCQNCHIQSLCRIQQK